MRDLITYDHGVHAVDAQYERPLLAAIHLIQHGGRLAVVDTGTHASLHHVITAIKALGHHPRDVDLVILTHVHLDHAGGSGVMMQAFENAHLVVHPRGARHMIDPTQLMGGVSAVYGADFVQRVYGTLLPVDARRVVLAHDGDTFDLAGRPLHILDTPGHARHHICIHDPMSKTIFTGDMFGLSYRETDVDGKPFIFPTTSPSQFDPEAMRSSINRIVALQPEWAYLTHFSRVGGIAALGNQLLKRMDHLVEFALHYRHMPSQERHALLYQAMRQFLWKELLDHGCDSACESALLSLWETDLQLNTQGLCIWAETTSSPP